MGCNQVNIFRASGGSQQVRGVNCRVLTGTPAMLAAGSTHRVWCDCYEGATSESKAEIVRNGGLAIYQGSTWQIVDYPDSVCTYCIPPTPPRYDQINGLCVDQRTLNTYGKYATLAECTANLGGCPPNYCPPGKVCITDSEWSQIESLANNIKNKDCENG
jgi:hypothetical protein